MGLGEFWFKTIEKFYTPLEIANLCRSYWFRIGHEPFTLLFTLADKTWSYSNKPILFLKSSLLKDIFGNRNRGSSGGKWGKILVKTRPDILPHLKHKDSSKNADSEWRHDVHSAFRLFPTESSKYPFQKIFHILFLGFNSSQF